MNFRRGVIYGSVGLVVAAIVYKGIRIMRDKTTN